jgi:hypothetical protein
MSSDDAGKIKKQVEYYFGDSNFRRDRWLRNEVGKDPEGWMDVSVLTNFKRLAAITTDVEAIAAAIADSTVVTLSDDKKRLRRTKPLPSEDDSHLRTVYMKGFPADASLDQLESGLEPAVGAVSRIVMRRFADKKFKGSCFVEFPTVEKARDVAAMPSVEFEGKALEKVMMSAEYKEAKKEQRRAAKAAEQLRQKQGLALKALTDEYKAGVVVRIATTKSESDLGLGALKDFLRGISEGVRYVEMPTADNAALLVRCKTGADATALKEGLEKLAGGEGEGVEACKTLLGDVPSDVTILSGEDDFAYWRRLMARKFGIAPSDVEWSGAGGDGEVGEKRKRAADDVGEAEPAATKAKTDA